MTKVPLNKDGALFPAYVVSGDELLLQIECLDELRRLYREQGFVERIKFSMQGNSNWQEILQECQNVSLFAEKKLIEIEIPSGKPGREGAEVLGKLGEAITSGKLVDTAVVISLPKLDRATMNSKWAKQLWQDTHPIVLPVIKTAQLPQWIQSRLKQQNQTVDTATLHFISEQVEGNLLAAHQEILKLGLSYPEGHISQEDIEKSVQDVARYNIFSLSNAMLSGDSVHTIRIIKGLEAEGEALPLVLAFVLRDIRDLYQLTQARDQGRPIAPLMKQLRIFPPREHLIKQAVQRLSFKHTIGLLQHAHDIDRIFKGFPVNKRLNNGWEELVKLALRVTDESIV